MSGHSKWSKIKRQKGINDKAKGALFAKLSRIVTLAVIEGGGITDPENNVRLRLAIEKAKSLNMPKENVQRAIEKGAGPNRLDLKEVVYEAFAPHGVSLIIVATTDNSNRTFAEIRNILDRNGGKMGTVGSVSYLFQKCGVATFESAATSEEELLELGDKVNALDIEQDEEVTHMYFPFEYLGKMREYTANMKVEAVEVDYRPLSTVELSPEVQTQIENIVGLLEELEDVQNVYMNIV